MSVRTTNEHLVKEEVESVLINQTVKEFVASIASETPAPGGGSVAALSGAMAAGLGVMVCNLTLGREKFASFEVEISEVQARLTELQKKLLTLVDKDTEAFNLVMAAYKLPKESESDKAARLAEIQVANREASEVPLLVAQSCLEILKIVPVLIEKGNQNAITDMGVAARMAESGLQGAIYNVRVNLSSIKDTNFVAKANELAAQLLVQGKILLEQVHTGVVARL